MPGVAQVWLTEDEIEATLKALDHEPFDHIDSDAYELKLLAARKGVACSVPAKGGHMIKTDGKPTIAWDPRPLPVDTPPIPDTPTVDGEELDLVGALTLAP